ncbi:MAG: PLDc N-terminal domain-containing protein [Clostridia bacterium]|nr:PLDc N-terminal domain-containing protein [Clostridia bacterium]
MDEFKRILPFLIPAVLIHYTLVTVSLIDLYKRNKVRFNNKWIWLPIIILIQVVGPVIYLLAKGDDD